jgi:CheY-like chemotaxis protein
MKGSILVESQAGSGSEFIVTVTVPTVEQQLPKKPLVDVLKVRSEFCDRSILVVDDVDFNRRVLCRFLKDLGFTTVVEAQAGLDAIQIAQMKDFAVIFMDICMPGMDGIAATGRIRTLHNHHNTPVIGLSASVTDESNLKECRDTFDKLISKPFRFEEIQYVLEEQCGFKFDSVQLATGGLHVLVVDDQAMIRRLVAIELNKDAIDVEQCASGREAIERLKSQKFDVILLDRLMPDMNGIETAARIRQEVPNPPAIIIMSSDLQPVDVANCKKAGVDEVMEKPIKVLTFKLLWDKIKADGARKVTTPLSTS